MSECSDYNVSWSHLFIPPIQILFKLCNTYDKTNLFLVSLIRLGILSSLFYILKNRNVIEINKDKFLKSTVFIIFVVYLVINVIYLLIVLIKKAVINKNELENTANGIASYLENNKLTTKKIRENTTDPLIPTDSSNPYYSPNQNETVL